MVVGVFDMKYMLVSRNEIFRVWTKTKRGVNWF